MIDRVAAALLSKFREVAEESFGRLDEAPHVYIDGNFDLRELARIAIEEMRTPTEAMENAAWSVEGATLAWEGMIDAALGDREGNGTERPQVERDKSRDEPR